MAKAVCQCRNPRTTGGQVAVDLAIALDNGQVFVETATVNFARSVGQLVADIKAVVITAAAIPGRDQTLTATDVVLFGGPA